MGKLILDTNELYDTKEAASELGIGYATLYRWIKGEKIIPVRLMGRTLIPKSEIDRIKQKKEAAVMEQTTA